MKLHRIRMRQCALLIAAVTVLALLAGAVANAAGGPVYVPNEYIIRVVAGTSQSAVEKAVNAIGATVIARLPIKDVYLIKVGSTGVGGTVRSARLAASTVVPRYVITDYIPNAVIHKDAIPVGPNWADMWGMQMIHAPQAWDVEKGSPQVTVGVLDSGTAQHPSLISRLVSGYDFIDNDPDATNDLDGHGTHVAGTIAADGDISAGISGVCWQNVKIMPIRVLDENGQGDWAKLIQGLDWAMTHNCDVINMSLGSDYPYSQPLVEQKLIELQTAGIIMCAAAGNSHGGPVGTPACYDETIAVSAVGPTEALAPYSSYGPSDEVDIAAPGGDQSQGPDAGILSTTVEWAGTTPMFSYGFLQGTSMACPHVTGAAALLLSAGVPASDVRARLQDTARPPKPPVVFDRTKFGYGILDLAAALQNGMVRIAKPVKGSTVTSNPDFKINVRGINPDSIKVYVDYIPGPDGQPLIVNPDGSIANETPVLSGVLARSFLNSSETVLQFNWAQISSTPLSSGDNGLHYVYITARTAIGTDVLSDWGTFDVSSKVISAGVHLFTFPYSFATSTPDGNVTIDKQPFDVLSDTNTGNPVSFSLDDPNRARLMRWLAPYNNYYSYVTYGSNPQTPRFDDRCWLNPLARMTLPNGLTQVVVTGGGFMPDDQNRRLKYPAGAGFWLILRSDAVVDDTIAPINAGAGYNIPLYRGWNLIGSPYIYPVARKSILLTYQGITKTLDEAATGSNPWVRPFIYGYKSVGTPGYENVPDRGMLQPYEGYWIMANVGTIDPYQQLVMTIQP